MSFVSACLRGCGLVAALTIAAGACAPKTMKLPSGQGTPAPDAAEVIDAATATCRGVRTLTAEVAVSGKVGGHRLRGRLMAGLAAPASARLEAVAPFGAPMFIFVARGGEATLLLPRDERVLEHAKPAAVLEAIAGVPLTPDDLRTTLTGCAPRDTAVQRAEAFGDDWRRATIDGGSDVYLHRDPDRQWRTVSVRREAEAGGHAWTGFYSDFRNDLPRSIRIMSAGPHPGDEYDLTLALSQVEINVPLEADVFHIDIPKQAEPITLDELRRSGPLADRKTHE